MYKTAPRLLTVLAMAVIWLTSAWLSGCSIAGQLLSSTNSPSPRPPTSTRIPPTVTLTPPATITPRPKTTATYTPAAKYAAQETLYAAVLKKYDPVIFKGYCMPSRSPIATPMYNSPLELPPGAVPYLKQKDTYRLKVPALFCTIILDMGSRFQDDTKLEFSYPSANKPWLVVDLKPVLQNPNAGYADLTHTYIINPPAWVVTYRMTARAGDGKELYTTNITMWATQPVNCGDGSIPDPASVSCPDNEE